MLDVRNVLAVFQQEIKDEALFEWFQGRLAKMHDDQSLILTFGLAGRKIPSLPLSPGAMTLHLLQDWTLDQLARLCLLLNIPITTNKEMIRRLLGSADIREQVTIYKSIPYLENAADFKLIMTDGIRTNMADVFDSIALQNPFPQAHFSDEEWNQMVLKAIFMERPIFKIVGLDARRNAKLAMILSDFAHERWSAGRSVTPELWRMMPGYITNQIFEDLCRTIEGDEPLAQEAATKALLEGSHPRKDQWMQNRAIKKSTRSWQEIGRENNTES